MKKFILLLLLFPPALLVDAQKKSKQEEAFYVMDENHNGTSIDKAVFLIHSFKKNDTCWQFDTYNMYGPMISSEQYNDEKATVLHGEAVYFNAGGSCDSITHFFNGLPHGDCYYLNDTGKIILTKTFSMGTMTGLVDHIKQDSLNAATVNRKIDIGETIIEIESEFPGGLKGWIKYLTNNMEYPKRAMDANKQGGVRAAFIVDANGHVYNEQIVKSVEYSLDQEALRLIKKSPAWIPAFQNGKKVKSYKVQPITFRFR